jgi:hypothetical protein
VQAAGQPVPAEVPEGEERGLQEERQHALDGQGGPEDVAVEAGERAPPHAELELLHQAGDHADGERDDEQLADELGQPQVLLVAGAHPGELQPGGDRGQADRQRHEEVVVDGHDRELQPGQVEHVHAAPLYDIP